MAPFTRPRVEIAVASQVSPTGATAAGRHGLSLLSVGATSTGGFNALSSNWAIAEQTKRSYELIARYVMPEFQGSNNNRQASYDWAGANHGAFMGAAMMAVGASIKRHMDEKGDDNISPELSAAIKMAGGSLDAKE